MCVIFVELFHSWVILDLRGRRSSAVTKQECGAPSSLLSACEQTKRASQHWHNTAWFCLNFNLEAAQEHTVMVWHKAKLTSLFWVKTQLQNSTLVSEISHDERHGEGGGRPLPWPSYPECFLWKVSSLSRSTAVKRVGYGTDRRWWDKMNEFYDWRCCLNLNVVCCLLVF